MKGDPVDWDNVVAEAEFLGHRGEPESTLSIRIGQLRGNPVYSRRVDLDSHRNRVAKLPTHREYVLELAAKEITKRFKKNKKIPSRDDQELSENARHLLKIIKKKSGDLSRLGETMKKRCEKEPWLELYLLPLTGQQFYQITQFFTLNGRFPSYSEDVRLSNLVGMAHSDYNHSLSPRSLEFAKKQIWYGLRNNETIHQILLFKGLKERPHYEDYEYTYMYNYRKQTFKGGTSYILVLDEIIKHPWLWEFMTEGSGKLPDVYEGEEYDAFRREHNV